jgi:uncharacterized oligopeptide transporter (OPT) family protein
MGNMFGFEVEASLKKLPTQRSGLAARLMSRWSALGLSVVGLATSAMPAGAVTNFTTDAQNVGSGVWMIAVLGVIVAGVIAIAAILASQQGKFTKGIELFLTVVSAVLISGQITQWGTDQGTQRATTVAALFAGIPGQTGTTTSAFSADAMADLTDGQIVFTIPVKTN